MKIIPAIDIIEGKCVRLTQGDYGSKKVYSESPLEVAKNFEGNGIEYLHLVDLDGAKAKHVVNYKVLEDIATKTQLKIDFGGGIKSDIDLRIALECGAQQITAGSIAVRNPDQVSSWLEVYGGEKIILGADVSQGKIALQGWTESSELDLFTFLESYVQKGIQNVICTDISKDGMLGGPSLELYGEILQRFPELSLIASGGIAGIDDIYRLNEIGCTGVIIGKAIYEGQISLKQIERYVLESKNISF